MKLALLKGNRFNPWHLSVYQDLQPPAEITAFRAESEIQRYFEERDDSDLNFAVQALHFDTDAGPLMERRWRRLQYRFQHREPCIRPFASKLKDFDLIQSWELFTDWSYEAVLAKRQWDIPLCVKVWDNIPFNKEEDARRLRIKEAVLEEADCFIVHSERSRRTLVIEGADPKRIQRMGPGVDTKRFCPGPGKRSDYALPEDAFVLLFVGWLLPRKGIDFLLLALRDLILEQAQPVHLLIAGSGPGQDRVEDLIARLHLEDQIHFLGSQPYSEMPALFQSADAFVLPSIATPQWQEQFGMSLLEAMSCSVPVISTYSGAIPEIVGDAGLLCQANDFLALRQAIERLMDSKQDRKELGARGRDRVLRHFSLEQYARDLSQCYQNLLV